MKRILLLIIATLSCIAFTNTAKAQSLYLNVNGQALYTSEGGDCNGGAESRWRASTRNSSNAGWNNWDVNEDDGGGGWRNFTFGNWYDGGGVPLGDNVQVRLNALEEDGGICFDDDGNCGGYATIYDTQIVSIGGCQNPTLERFRTCSSDGTTITWGVRFDWRYYVENPNGGAVRNSAGTTSQTICSGTAAGAFTNLTSATLAGTNGLVGYQWQSQANCTGGWVDIAGAQSATYNPGTPTSTTCYRRRARYITTFGCGTTDVYSNTLTITVDQFTTAAAGADQTVCATSATLAGNTPTTGVGTWTVISGSGTFTNANSPTSGVSGLSLGANTFRWTLPNGVCSDSFDEVIITRNDFTTAAAGPDQTLCATSATLAGNSPATGVGAWTVISGTGTFTNANSPTSGVSSLSLGANVFRWTLPNGVCTDSFDEVTITRNDFTTAAAGPDQTLCDATSTNLAGNIPATGVGTWTIQSGCAGCTFSNANNPTTAVNNLPYGTSVLRWTLPNGVCTDSFDEMTIVNDGFTAANAGSDQTICDVTSTILGGNTPITGVGTWTIVGGTCVGCTFSDVNNPGATLSNIPAGTHTVRWTLPNGSCTDSFDDISITRDQFTAADAGVDQNLCGATSATLAGNAPVTGVGTWTVTGCPTCSFSPNANTPGATINGLGTGTYTLTWTLLNGTCSDSQASITIVNDAFTTADAGADQTFCDNTSTTLAGNTPTSGVGLWVVTGGCVGCTFTPNASTPGATLGNIPAGVSTLEWQLTNGNCANSADQVTITRNVTGSAAFNYSSATYCENAGTNPVANITGTTGGLFTANSANLVFADNTTGEIDLVASTPGGPYVITYTTPLPCPTSTTVQVTILPADNSNFSYAQASYCQNVADPTPSVTVGGGTFTADAGLVIDANTGQIDVSASTIGGPYNVTYTSAGPCTTSTTQQVSIVGVPDPSFSYAQASYCTNNTNPVPNSITTPGGTFSTTAGLNVNSVTGQLSLSGATPGVYNIRYITGSPCPDTAFFQVTIILEDDASFSFDAASYCRNGADGVATITGLGGGTFSAGAGLAIDANTGAIDVSASTVGTYTVTYTTNGVCPNTSTQQVVIVETDNPSFSYADPTICINGSNPVPTITGLNGGTFTVSDPQITINPATGEIDLSQSVTNLPFVVTYTTNGPCPESATQSLILLDAPVVSIIGLDADYCINEPTANLVGSPTGGTFAGLGIVGNTFNPTLTVAGTHTITYTYTDGNNCTVVASQQVVIYGLPFVSVSGLASSYCTSDNTPYPITVSPAGGTLSGPGISGTDFIPSTAGTGSVTITYTYTDGNSCTNSATQSTVVNTLPVVGIAGLNAAYCIDAGTVTLTGIPAGGTFSGPGISGNSFNAATAGVGTHTITYNYSDGNGCSNSTTQQVTVNDLPTVSIVGLNAAYCSNASAVALVGNPPGGTFSGNGVSGSQLFPNLVTGGQTLVTYSYTDGNSCTNTSSQLVTINAAPVVSIDNLNSQYCISAATVTLAGTPTGGTFAGPGVTAGVFDPAAAGLGTHTITYTYTDGNSCTSVASQQVTIVNLPTVAISNLAPAYCVDAATVTMTGIPAGGTFSGVGVSGNTFTPSIAGAGVHTITYFYTDGNGCSNSTTQNVTVNPLPTPSISGLAASYCADAAAVALTGTPTGGTFSGTGISGNTFNPSIAGAGTFTVTYTYTDGNSCTGSATQQVTVNPLPVVNFTGLASQYCISETNPQPLTGNPAGGTFSGPGISGTDFTPSVAGVGTHTITYSYTDGNGCSASFTQQVVINNFPQVAITNLASQYCVTAGLQTLSGVPSGGTFSGPGVTGNSFDPATAGVGIHTITYSYSDANGCSNTATQQVQINAQPTLSLVGLNAAYCVDVQQVIFSGIPAGGTYGGPGVSGNIFYPSVAGVGTHTVTYSYTDGNGCSNSTSQSVVVNPLPTVSFSGLAPSYCVSNNSSVTLTGTPAGGTFSGPGISGDDFTPANAGNGTHTITYTYQDGNGCTGTSTQTVVVNTLPQVAITNLATQYCVTAGVQAIGGLPAGGSFSGPGIVGNTFDPATAGVGVHTITYTYSDGNNCSNSASQQVQVYASPTVTMSGLAAAYCVNAPSVALTGAPTGGTFSGPGISGNSFFPSIAGVGTHTVTYSYTDGNGCGGSTTQQVVVNPGPTVSFNGLATSYCVSDNNAVTLTGTPSGGAFSGNGTSGNTFTPSVAGVGTHTITYTYSDVNGCGGTSTQQVVVNALPQVAITNLAAQYCVNAGVQTLGAIPAGGTFSGNGVVGTSFNPSLAGVGVHTITYAYTDANSCSNTATQQVQVYAQPTVAISGLASVYCSNATPVTFTGTPTGGTFGGPGVSGNTFFPNIAGPGTHTITYNYSDPNGCGNTATQAVVVNAAPQPAFVGLASAYCASVTSVTLVGTPANGVFSGSGVTGNTFNPSSLTPGPYTLTYTVTDANSCTGAVSQLVSVNPLPNVGFAGLASTYCTTSPAVQLTGFPAGGTFSGVGVVQPATFDPAQAQGVNTVSYTYTDGNGCTNSYTQFVTVNQAPAVSFTGLAATYCEGEGPVTLIGTPTGGNFTGNGISGNQFNPMFAGLGIHTITYTYLAGNGCSGTAQQQVLINPAPIVSIVGVANSYCVNSPIVNLTGVPSGGQFSGPGVSNSQFDPSQAVLGQNFINYQFTDGNGCVGSADVITTVSPLENASFFFAQQSFCQTAVNDPAPTITGVGGGTFTAGAGLAIDASTGVIDLSASTVGSYTVTYTTSGACPGVYTFPVNITNGANAGFSYNANAFCNNLSNPLPTITGDFGGQFTATPAGLSINNITGEINLGASVVGGPYTVTYAVGGACPGSQTFDITVNDADDATFSYPLYSYCQSAVNVPTPTVTGNQGGVFANNDGAVVNPTTGAIDLLASTQGLHTITYTTGGLCPATYSVDVFITNGPVADITASGPTTFCFGGSVLLDAGAGYETYQWSNPSGVTTQVVSVSTSGVYSVVVTDSSGCSSTDAVSVLVYQDPVAAFTFGTFSLTASFSNLSSNGQTYTWDFGDSSPLSNEPNPVHTYVNDGTYNVTLIVENICGSDTIMIPVTVTKVGIDETAITEFDLYPNPNDGNFTVTFNVASKEDIAINVTDVTGRHVFGEALKGYSGAFTKQYNFNSLESGVYLFSIRTDKGVLTKRIVIN